MTFLKAHWRAVLVAVLVLAAFAGGYYSGRKGPTPENITEKSHVEENSHVEKTEDVKAAVKIEAVRKRRRIVTVVEHTEKAPDGATTTDKTTTVTDASDSSRNLRTDSVSTTSENSVNLRTEDKSKITTFQRDWRLGALVGAQLQNPVTHAGNPFAPTLFVAVTAEARLKFIPVVGEHLWLGAFVGATVPTNVPLMTVHEKGALFVGGSLHVDF